MEKLMRCPWCGLLQDEPAGVKVCGRCGGALEYEAQLPSGNASSCIGVQMELDQVAAPAGINTERYLLITLRTPASISAEEQAPAGKQRPPLGFTAVLDVSGSMQGDKIDHAKQAVRQAVGFLHAGDVFDRQVFHVVKQEHRPAGGRRRASSRSGSPRPDSPTAPGNRPAPRRRNAPRWHGR